VIASSLALAACDRTAAEPIPPNLPALKSVAPAPFGTAIKAMQIDDPDWVALARAQVSQLTPEWEMKMEYVLADGLDRPRFDRSDRIAAFAARHGMALHGHTLIWYSQGAEAFAGLAGAAFDRAFDGYVAAMAGRYRGKVRSWDVVNEPILDDGSGMRDCHWSARYGHDGYILRAFEQARAADPDAVLFLNEYNQESVPAKGVQFLKLVERLLKAGCPLQGLGLQSHLWIDIPEGALRAFMREAAQFGLPIHVSELDCTLRTENRLDLRGAGQRIAGLGAELDVGGGRVELQLLDAGRTGDRDDAGQADQPRQRDLGQLRVDLRRHVAQRLEQRLDAAQVLGAEQGIDRADAPGPVVDAVLAAEQALGEGAVGDHDAVLAFGERHQGVQRPRLGEGEVHLVADDWPPECGVGFLPPRERVVRHARGADGTAVEQFAHPRHDHRVGHHRVGLVDLVERDPVELQPAGAGTLTLLDHGREGCDRHDLARHHHLGALVAERFAEDVLAPAEAVDLGRVEQGHAEGQRTLDDVGGRAGRVAAAVAPLAGAELPGAQSDSADPAEPVDVEVFHADHGTDLRCLDTRCAG